MTCLIEICTFAASDEMFVNGDDLTKLIAEAEERAKAAQIAEAAQTKPPAETPTRTLVALIGPRAAGWF
jgi:hypothetical protein